MNQIMRQRQHWLKMNQEKAEIDINNLASVVDHLANFSNMAPNLLDTDQATYGRWFEKLYRLDKLALLFYIAAHQDKLTHAQLEFTKNFYNTRNKAIDWETVEKIARSMRG